MADDKGSVIVAGASGRNGLGAALARRFAQAGYGVAVAGRRPENLSAIAASGPGGRILAVPTDLTQEAQVTALFDRAETELGPLAIACFNAGNFVHRPILDLDPAVFEASWRANAFAGFLVGREAARRQISRGQGTILFTGATAALRGGSGFAAFASGKFALRAVAQSMARELGPKGIHVAHVVVDGVIAGDRTGGEGSPDTMMAAADIAESCFHIAHQNRSAWTFEWDLRPWTEKF